MSFDDLISQKKDEMASLLSDFESQITNLDLPIKHRSYKTVLLGSCGAGKTSIVTRYVRGMFDPTSNSTIGAAFIVKTIPTTRGNIKLDIWDTAGQERYDSLMPMYYRDASIAFVVFDLTDEYSFEKAQKWVKILKASKSDNNAKNSNLEIILIGNKFDKANHLVDKLAQDGQEFADENTIPFVKTSAKTGDGIGELFLMTIMKKLENEKNNKVDPPKDPNQIDLAEERSKGLFSSCLNLTYLNPLNYKIFGGKSDDDHNDNDDIYDEIVKNTEGSVN